MSKQETGSRSQRIASAPNRLIREARALERDRSRRVDAGLYLAWGVHPAQETLRRQVEVVRALIGPALERTDEGTALLRDLEAVCPEVIHTTGKLLDTIITGCGDQGILVMLRRPVHDLQGILARSPTMLLVAHGIQDPGNLGSIVRTACAFGVNGLIVLEGCTDPYSSRAVRAAMGAQLCLPIASSTVTEAIDQLSRAGLQIAAADPAGNVLPAAVDFRRATALFVGSEGAGLPAAILRVASVRVRIPMQGEIASLNVHAASSALLYEAARQRGAT